MNRKDYQNMFHFINKIDPTAINFSESVCDAIKEIFGYPEVYLNIFQGSEPMVWRDLQLPSVEQYKREDVFLHNGTDIIGVLSMMQNKEPGLDQNNQNEIMKELVKILENTVKTHRKYYNLKTNLSMMNRIMSQLPTGIVLCDSNFQILYINDTSRKIMKLFEKNISKSKLENILMEKFLSEYVNSGKCEYFIKEKEYPIQLAIHNQIIHNLEKGSYTTCYQITMNYQDEKDETQWNEFLINKELTKRECEICNLMRLDYSNDEIADKLHISKNTVKRHRESIYRKLNISRINQLNLLYENNLRVE